MMSPFTAIAIAYLLLRTAFGQASFGYQIGEPIKQKLHIIDGAVSMGTSLTEGAVQHGTDIGKKVMVSVNQLGKEVLDRGTDLAKENLKLVDITVGNIPFVRHPVKIATGISRWLLTLGKRIGEGAIKAGTDLGGNAMDFANKATKLTTGSIKTMSNTGTTLAKEAIDTSIKTMNDFSSVVPSPEGMFPAEVKNGEGAIKAGTDLGGNAMDFANKATRLTTGSIKTMSNTGTTFAKEAINTAVKTIDDFSSLVPSPKGMFPAGVEIKVKSVP